MTRIYLFPGQGSQSKGMGADLFPLFPELTEAASNLLGYSIQDLCLQDPHNQLGQTQFTQPALYIVNALTFLKRLGDTAELPHFVAGHSLGEYDALFAAGVFDFLTGLRLVIKRGDLMSKASGGGMAAVIGLTYEQIEQALKNVGSNSIDLANLNAPTQIVISGPAADIKNVIPTLEKAGAQMVKQLNVSAAFHSRYMTDAQKEFSAFLEKFTFHPPRITVIANATARPYEATKLNETLASQITNSVRWTDSIRYLLQQPDPQFFELGPGNVLTGLLRRIKT